MAKKDKQNTIAEGIGGVLGFFRESLMFFAKDIVKEKFDQAMNYVEERLAKMQDRLLRAVATMFLLLCAAILALLAGFFFLIDSLKMSRPLAILCFAAALALLAFIIDYTGRRKKQ